MSEVMDDIDFERIDLQNTYTPNFLYEWFYFV